MYNKKNTRILLISLAALVILGGAIALLRMNAPDEPDNPVPEETRPERNVTVFTGTDTDFHSLVSVYITNGRDDGYTIIPNARGDYLINELEERGGNIPYNNDAFSSIVAALTSLSSFSTVEENAEDLDKYGLLSPLAAVKAVFSKTADTTADLDFSVGNATPDGGTYYFCLNGENTVYAVETRLINWFFYERHDWINKLAFPQYNANDAPAVNRIKVERSDLDEPIIVEAIPKLSLEELRTFNSHRIVSPLNIDADPEKSTAFIYGIFGLTAANVVWVVPEEVDYEMTGLDEPRCTVEVTAGEQVYTLTLGDDYSEDNGFYSGGVYGMSSNVPDLVFLFNRADVPWLTVNAEDLVSDVFLTPYIYSLDKLVVETGGEVLEFTVTGDDEDNSVIYNGAELKGGDRERFSELYQFLIGIRGDSLFTEETPDSEPIAKITYIYRDNLRESDTVEYLKGDNRKSIIRVNGDNIFTCTEMYTKRLVENVTAFTENKAIINDW